MKLLYSPTSPYARKVRVLAYELSIDLPVVAVNTHGDNRRLLDASPAGKVPVLSLADGTYLQDSRVICDYLDTVSNAARPPAVEQAREALAEAIIDAALLVVLEGRRAPSERSASAIDREVTRIQRLVAAFDATPPRSPEQRLNREQIGLAVGLDYLDFRLPDIAWRSGHPTLRDWFNEANTRPSMIATRPPSP